MSNHAGIQLIANVIAAAPERGKWRVRRWASALIERHKLAVNHTFHVKRQHLQWELNPSDEVDRELFWFAEKEPGDEVLFTRLAGPGAVILDVGANFGYYSLRLAHRLRGQCTVHAFEPNPPTYARLQRHIQANRITCIQAHPFGLGESESTFPIVYSSDNTGAAYLSKGATGMGSVTLTARVAALDAVAGELSLNRVDLVKVDIEGHEVFFLKGAARTLGQSLPAMMMEVNPENLARNGHTATLLLDQLRQIGYREFYVRTENSTEVFTERVLEGNHFRNVFCFRQRPASFPLGLIRIRP